MNFDFLHDGERPTRSRNDETHEDRDPGLMDCHGRRITYSVRRVTYRETKPAMHLRWVCVLRDGEIAREFDSNGFVTFAEAEQWVEGQIARSVAAYRRAGPGLNRQRPRRAQAARSGNPVRLLLIVAVVILAAPAIGVVWLMLILPR